MCIEDMVFGHAASENDDSRLWGFHGNFIDLSRVTYNIASKLVFVGVGKEYVTDSTVGESWTVDGDVVVVAPVVDAVWVVDLLAEALYHLARGPVDLLFLLFFKHGLE